MSIAGGCLLPRLQTLRKTGSSDGCQVFAPRLSKPVIDEIDKVLAQHYGFTDKEEVLNYIHVFEKLNTLPTNGEISEVNIKNIQKLLTVNTIDDPRDCGVYRSETKKYVVVGNRLTGEISFRPPANIEIPKLMQDYVQWLNSDKARGLDPVIMAGIAHYEFVRIHPSVDGNGRTARVIAALILRLRGFDTKRFFCLDDYYDMDRTEYYKALRAVHPQKRDLTRWLEYFVEGVAISIDAVRERIVRLSTEHVRTKKKGQIALTERQRSLQDAGTVQGMEPEPGA
ncbi:MAG: Fic family protein [Syntrophales bacterium]